MKRKEQFRPIPDGQLFSEPKLYPVRVPGLHRFEVPAHCCALLRQHGKAPQVLSEGWHRLQDLSPGRYLVQYVDMRRLTVHLDAIRGLTMERLPAALNVVIEYKVSSPAKVVQLSDPMALLREWATSCILGVMAATYKDILMRARQGSSKLQVDIAQRIRDRLAGFLSRSGLQIDGVFVTRIQAYQGSYDEATLKQRCDVEQARGGVEMAKAQNHFIQAYGTMEEDLLHERVEDRRALRQQWQKQAQWEHEETMKRIEAQQEYYKYIAAMCYLQARHAPTLRQIGIVPPDLGMDGLERQWDLFNTERDHRTGNGHSREEGGSETLPLGL